MIADGVNKFHRFGFEMDVAVVTEEEFSFKSDGIQPAIRQTKWESFCLLTILYD